MKFFGIAFGFACLFSCTISNIDSNRQFDFSRVVARVAMMSNHNPYSTGTAVLVNTVKKNDHFELMFLTAKHVIEDAPIEYTPVIQFFDYSTCFQAEMPVTSTIKYPGGMDLAILITETQEQYFPIFCDTEFPLPMSEVLSIGFSLNAGLVASEGLMSNPSHMQTKECIVWLCTAPVYLGGSGGAVIDKKTGHLLGITTKLGYDRGSMGGDIYITFIHYFIPIKYINEWLRTVKQDRLAA